MTNIRISSETAIKNNLHLIRYMMMSRQNKDPFKLYGDPKAMYPHIKSFASLTRDGSLNNQSFILWSVISYIATNTINSSNSYFHSLTLDTKDITAKIPARHSTFKKGIRQLTSLNMARMINAGRQKQIIINPEYAHWIPKAKKKEFLQDMINIITLKELHDMFFEREFYFLKEELQIV